MTIASILEPIGVFVFAISGAMTAIKKQMDIFGVLVLATVTAAGGGIIRDVVMDRGIPVVFSNYNYIVLIILATIFISNIRGSIKMPWLVTLCDAAGLAIFTIDAGVKAIDMNLNFMAFMFMSVITGVGGGVLRDIMSKEVPVIFRQEVYAVASIVGAAYLWVALPYIGERLAVYTGILIILAVRMVSAYFNVNLPRIDGFERTGVKNKRGGREL